ncbi:MAG: hypothetical protein IKW06_01625 [Clostridia bacterium]|nr:hypothetical protein [Clostridia bacterium]
MNRKIAVLLIGLLCAGMLTACGNNGSASKDLGPVPEGITNPEGGIVSINPKVVEGRIIKLSDKRATLLVQKVEWDMSLSEKVQSDIKRYAELEMPMEVGGFVLAYYEETEEGKREITRLEHLVSN